MPLPVLSDEVASPGAAGTDRVQGVASHVMFLGRGKLGPFRVEGEVAGGPGGAVAVRALLHDEGADDRAVTAASYLFRVEGS